MLLILHSTPLMGCNWSLICRIVLDLSRIYPLRHYSSIHFHIEGLTHTHPVRSPRYIPMDSQALQSAGIHQGLCLIHPLKYTKPMRHMRQLQNRMYNLSRNSTFAKYNKHRFLHQDFLRMDRLRLQYMWNRSTNSLKDSWMC